MTETVVAVAGGTGGLGRTIVDAILAVQKYKVVILSRETSPEAGRIYGAPVVAIDYDDIDSITEVLQVHDVHTVVSTLNFLNGPGHHQDNLIWAAEKSACTKRFVPSVWNTPLHQAHVDAFPLFAPIARGIAAIAKTTSLEYTVVYNGMFLDYYLTPRIPTYMDGGVCVCDIAHNTASLPGDGDVPVAFVHTKDVARLFAASLALPKWPNQTWIIGDKVTWKEFVRHAEAAKGTKFLTYYDSIEMMQQFKITELPGAIEIYHKIPREMAQYAFALHGLWFAAGDFDLKATTTPLEEQFPKLKPDTVELALRKAWG